MAGINWNLHFLSATRGRIITLLRRASRSVDELAQAPDLTYTAVRAHLVALEQDGLVQQRSEPRGNRKPSSEELPLLDGHQLFGMVKQHLGTPS